MTGSVLHVITGLSTGGAELALLKLLGSSEPLRASADVLSIRDRGTVGHELERLGIPVRALGVRGTIPTPAALVRLRRAVRERPPALLQGWMYHGNLAAWAAARLGARDRPVLWSIHHSLHRLEDEKPVTRRVISICARLSARVARVVYCSRASARQHEAVGYDPSRTVVIPYGFDTSRFRPSSDARSRVRAELGLSEDDIVVGVVARYHPLKDHRNFLLAIAQIPAHVRVHCLLAGAEVVPSNPALREQIARLGLADRVRLLGPTKDVPGLMAALDLLCSSSSSEALPNVIGEAMATGVPCVVTDVGDSAWLVGETGWVVPPREPGALAAALEQAAGAGPQVWRARGAAARARIEAELTLDRIASKHLTLYDEVRAEAEGL